MKNVDFTPNYLLTMPLSESSRYTPPLSGQIKARVSRSKDHQDRPTRRARPEVSLRERHRRKRDTYRSRSRRRRPSSENTDSSSSLAKRRKRRLRSTRRRHSTTTDATKSTDGSSEASYHHANKRRRRFCSSETSTSSWSSKSNLTRQSRERSRPNIYRKRRRSASSKSVRDSQVLKKLARLFSKNDHHFEGAQNVIPEFNPDANDQSAANWIRKVNETAKIYKWSDRQIIFYAIPKLAGHAKKWYQGQSTIDLSWREWQRKIMKAFPDDRNYADRLSEMLDRKSRREESLEDYYHDKARLVKMCGITGRNAVDCIINGIFDFNIRLNAQGSSFKRPSQLLKYLRRISKRNITMLGRPNKVGRYEYNTRVVGKPANVTYKTSTAPRDNARPIQCYNCLEMGHTSRTCPKPTKRCDKCSRLGHDRQKCELVNSFRGKISTNMKEDREIVSETPQKVLKILPVDQPTAVKPDGKYLKSITLNNTKCTAYIDFGSQCTLVRKSTAEASHLSLVKSGLPIIKGFAFGSVIPLGKVSVTIAVDEVETNIEAYVVEDHLLDTDVLIGQSLTELPTVVAHKTNSTLMLYCDELEADKINLNCLGDITLKLGLNSVDIVTHDKYSGPVFVPGSICMKPNSQYVLLQGIYQIENNKGQLIIINSSNEPICFKNNKVLSRAVKLPLNSLFLPSSVSFDVRNINLDNESALSTHLKHPTPKCAITMDMINVGPKISGSEKDRLLCLLNDYRECFALSTNELGLTNITEMKIRLNDNTPVTYKPYRLPFSERAKVREIISELLSNGVIRESQSAYSSPIVLVRKKNGDSRLCVDYRALNKKTIKDSYPMPVIDDQLDRLSGKSLFTSLDLASGYHQIPVAEDSRHITGFVTPDGHYEYTRMPFGLINAPAVFQSMINQALGTERFNLAIPYLDDLLCSASSTAEMFEKLESIFKLLKRANLTLNLKKCFFCQTEVDYLGYEISEEGLKPGSKKIQAVQEFPRPTNVHQVRQFVGLASFFRRFVYNFACLARPLTKLTKVDVPWVWGKEQDTAFLDIKSRLVSRPVLALYNAEYITEVHCDASKMGVGGILLQKPDEKASLRPVAYFSRQTTKEEEFWHSYELETMAVVMSLKKFRVYLIGIEFKVVTDCSALRSTLTKRDLLPKVARWWLMLQEYNFTIEYRPGHNMQHVDALSRNPILSPLQEELEVLNITANDWLQTVQMTDPHLKNVKNILQTTENEIKDITTNYIIRDNKVYRKVGNKLKWVVPNSARWKICQMNHDEAGHFSYEKTLEKISSDYWFPKMSRFVRKYVKACINCAYNKESAGKKSGYLHPIPKICAIFHTIHMDHLGPFIKSKRGNSYILGIIDSFSKFIFIKGVRNTKSKTTIKVLEEIFSVFGQPKIIISDQGTSFTSSEFKNFTSTIGAKHVRNAVATPRANGQIERYNRTILNSLAAMNHGQDEKDWDLNLGKLQWSLNNTVNKGTGKSPAEIVFGQKTIGKSEGILKGALEQEEQMTNTEREDLRRTVQENIEDNQAKMKKTFDNSRAPPKTFQEGDLVMIPNHNPDKGKSKKLAPKFKGPFKVSSVLDKDRYEVSSIEGLSNRNYRNIFPADQLRPWITVDLPHSGNDDGTDSDDGSSE